MRKKRSAVIGMLAALLSTFVLCVVAQPAAATNSGICQEQPQDAVALMCNDGPATMYGYFITFIYPTPNYGGPPQFGYADLYDETNMITDTSDLSGGIAVGLDMHYIGSATQYRPYWIDYTNFGSYNYLDGGQPATQSDGKNHTFMVIPHCNGCATWDIFYDFNLVGTTGNQQAGDSFHMSTGWDLSGISGLAGFSQTQNRIRYLNGNYQFQQFDPPTVSTLSPDGDCSPGADPNYCFHFTTNISTVTNGSTTTVSSWDVSKTIISPPPASSTARPAQPPLTQPASDDSALLARAQHIVDQRLRAHR